jgi:membrane AbrB-like protein
LSRYTTARFSSVPGALGQVLVLALRANADLPRIALAQSLRVFVLVALMPWLLTGTGHGVVQHPVVVETLSLGGSILVLAAGAILGLLLERFRVPAGALLGAMLASAVLHGTGLVEGRLPGPLLLMGFVATGCVLGVRFGTVTIAMVRGTVRGAPESVALALVLSALFAILAQHWLGLPFGQFWMAYAPSGVEAMTIMAFALGLDPAFVGAYHVVRLMGLLQSFRQPQYIDTELVSDPQVFGVRQNFATEPRPARLCSRRPYYFIVKQALNP